MSTFDKINKSLDWIAAAGLLYFAGIAIAGKIKRNKAAKEESIGKVERIKRRIYKEVSLAQDAGVDFTKKYTELTSAEKQALERVGKDVGWKQSKRAIENEKPYVESYYSSLRRAWNAISGVQGIGTAYNVKDANGNICLTWIEDAAAHYDAETRTLEAEKQAAEARARLRKTRRSGLQPIAPSVPVVHESKQQQILNKFPYLKIMDDPFHPISNSTAFLFVLWKTQKNNLGEIMYEGPAMAFASRAAAEDAKAFLKKEFRKIQTDIWQEYIEELSQRFLEEDREHMARRSAMSPDERARDNYYSKHDVFYKDKDPAIITIKDVSKVNLDKISGIGYTPEIEDELFNIWREQLDYGDTDWDFETWMRKVGDAYL